MRSLEEELHTRLILRTTKKTTITTRGYQLYDSAVRMLEIRNNLLENFTRCEKHMIDLAASTIPSSYLLPESWQPSAKHTRISIFIRFRQTAPNPSTVSLTERQILLWSGRIRATRPASFFRSVRMSWSLPHRSPAIISACRTNQ